MHPSKLYIILITILVLLEPLNTRTHSWRQMAIVSSLQHSHAKRDHLAPYPAGVNLTLACNVPDAKPEWLEGGSVLSSFCPPGIQSCRISFLPLQATDDGCSLTCRAAGYPNTTVTLRVFDEVTPVIIKLSSKSRRDEVLSATSPAEVDVSEGAELTCWAGKEDPLLHLCWFRDGSKSNPTPGNGPKASVTLQLAETDAGSKFTCTLDLKHGDISLKLDVKRKLRRILARGERQVVAKSPDTSRNSTATPAAACCTLVSTSKPGCCCCDAISCRIEEHPTTTAPQVTVTTTRPAMVETEPETEPSSSDRHPVATDQGDSYTDKSPSATPTVPCWIIGIISGMIGIIIGVFIPKEFLDKNCKRTVEANGSDNELSKSLDDRESDDH